MKTHCSIPPPERTPLRAPERQLTRRERRLVRLLARATSSSRVFLVYSDGTTIIANARGGRVNV